MASGRPVLVRLAGVLLVTAAGTAAVASNPGLCPTPAGTAPPPEPGGRPNLVLILTDDQRWDSLWAMPSVQGLLGGHGVTFENAFVTTALCCPSRTSILTGEASRHTGVLGNSPPNGGATAFDDRSTVATWLHDAGYTTGLFGKYLNGYQLLSPGYTPPGWDRWVAIAQRNQIRQYRYTLNEDGRLVEYGDRKSDYGTTVLADHAREFARTAREPFFVELAPIAPHLPATPERRDVLDFPYLPPHHPPSFGEDPSDKPWWPSRAPDVPPTQGGTDFANRRMLQSLQAVDREVLGLVCDLSARGVLDRTVIVFASDNGFLLGEHGLTQKAWPYEEAIRIPLVVRVPWSVGRATDDHLVLNVDLASTFAELAGVTPPLSQDGRSLVPLLHGRRPAWRDAFVVEYLAPEGPDGPPPYSAIRTTRQLYVEYENGWRELYDLDRDPYELTNLADRPGAAPAVERLHARLTDLLEA
jgi:arylsulfatase A-like enzyme